MPEAKMKSADPYGLLAHVMSPRTWNFQNRRPPRPPFWPLAKKEGEADLGFSFLPDAKTFVKPSAYFQQDGLCDIVHVRIVWIIWTRNYP